MSPAEIPEDAIDGEGDETGYAWLTSIARENNLRFDALLVKSKDNDPFFCGAPAHWRAARWFEERWQAFGYTSGVHSRRVHYRVVSLPESDPLRRHYNGQPYENTLQHWHDLSEASKHARRLRLIDRDDYRDQRNPECLVYDGSVARQVQPVAYGPQAGELAAPEMPSTDSDALDVDLSLPLPHLGGYDYLPDDQPYLLEVWIEKSTLDDVLGPICEELGINFQRNTGVSSDTRANDLRNRILASGKSARIFYLADFDPRGDIMPQSVGRDIEFRLWQDTTLPEGTDVKLCHLGLTLAQVQLWQLPGLPVNMNDTAAKGFTEAYGARSTELDALEALQPGELARMVREAASPYRDLDLAARLAEARQEAAHVVGQAWAKATQKQRDEVARLNDELRQITARYRDRLVRLDAELQRDLEPLRERAEAAYRDTLAISESFEVALPDRPAPKIELPDESSWLYDSGRDYQQQLAAYRARRPSAERRMTRIRRRPEHPAQGQEGQEG
jgi:hypothetical protein